MNAALDRRFMPEAEDRERLPVAVVSGFLGSGKTTLLNALLQHPRLSHTAVAINEFGAVPLDQHLIEHDADRTVVMANGCLCCNVAGDLEDAVLRIFSRRETGALPFFSRLIVEPSGFADPAPIAQAILRNPVMARVLRLDGIVTVVDAVFGAGQSTAQPEWARQVALADRIVVSKADMADPAPVRAAVARVNPAAPVLQAVQGVLDPALLFGAHFFDVRAAPLPLLPAAAPQTLLQAGHHAHGSDVGAVVLTHDAPLRWDAFEAWLRPIRLGRGGGLLRVKGLVDVGAAGPVVVQGVQHVLHPPVRLAAWPDADRRSRVVLIGRGLNDIDEGWREGWRALTA